MPIIQPAVALSVRQEAFCRHYAVSGNAADAARQAGYSDDEDWDDDEDCAEGNADEDWTDNDRTDGPEFATDHDSRHPAKQRLCRESNGVLRLRSNGAGVGSSYTSGGRLEPIARALLRTRRGPGRRAGGANP